MSFAKVASAQWFAFIYPFQFGVPTFHVVPIITMCVVMIVVMIESAGMFLALGDMVGKEIKPEDMTRGLRTDGIGTLIGGIFNTFPYTSFSQNVGLVGVTGIKSRFVCVAGGAILVAMGLVPEARRAGRGRPAVRARRRRHRDVRHGRRDRHPDPLRGRLSDQPQQPLRRGVSLGFGMIPLVAPTFFARFRTRWPDPAFGHSAHRHRRGGAQRVLQRRLERRRRAGAAAGAHARPSRKRGSDDARAAPSRLDPPSPMTYPAPRRRLPARPDRLRPHAAACRAGRAARASRCSS